jgi:plastocyanin
MPSRSQALIWLLISTSVSICQADDAGTGQLKMRFEYGGAVPAAAPIANPGQCGNANLVDERLVVNPKNKGIKNVIVYVYTGRGGSKLAAVDPPKNVVKLTNENCRFEPHVLIARAGDTIQIGNVDKFGHNTNLNFFANRALNIIVPSGQTKDVPIEKAERSPIPIDCNIHAWMRAYVVVLDHPYVAVSDDNGELTIDNLPAGGKLVFRAYHEAGAISNVKIGGNDEKWKRSRFEVDIKPGVNDVGTMVIPADALN